MAIIIFTLPFIKFRIEKLYFWTSKLNNEKKNGRFHFLCVYKTCKIKLLYEHIYKYKAIRHKTRLNSRNNEFSEHFCIDGFSLLWVSRWDFCMRCQHFSHFDMQFWTVSLFAPNVKLFMRCEPNECTHGKFNVCDDSTYSTHRKIINPTKCKHSSR